MVEGQLFWEGVVTARFDKEVGSLLGRHFVLLTQADEAPHIGCDLIVGVFHQDGRDVEQPSLPKPGPENLVVDPHRSRVVLLPLGEKVLPGPSRLDHVHVVEHPEVKLQSRVLRHGSLPRGLTG